MSLLNQAEKDGPISRTILRTFGATGTFLRKQLWVWPLVAAVILGLFGAWLRGRIEGMEKARVSGELRAVLNSEVEALRLMLRAHEALITIAADDPQVRDSAREVVTAGASKPAAASEMSALLQPWMGNYEFNGYLVIDKNARILAAHRHDLVGQPVNPDTADAYRKALDGRATVSRPFASRVVATDVDGELRAGTPVMYAFAPLRAAGGETFGVLALRMQPEKTFTRVLHIARFGKSGETYAFDRKGRLLSQSFFEEQLKRLGILADQTHVRSILNVEVRDPGVDMTTGARPKRRRSEQPLTRLAADAVQGKSGIDVDGYRDYRGVVSVGAWTWLPEYDFGVATEVDSDEAYGPLDVLRALFWSVCVLLALAALAIFVFSVVVARLRRSVQQAAIAAKQLGWYRLEEKIGEGGMGAVYRAQHALLRRPTAIKLLLPERTTDAAIARFEREVQLTSQLNHPNTINIYDYGRTPEGIFYYAMEYLDGLSLQSLIDSYGPQPDGRVIDILTQVCGSLAEAHELGLIHRDIKPANIVLNRRGGTHDVVKVVDFGLAKATDAMREGALSVSGTLRGTPLYMAPESVTDPEHLDGRSDLYSVGATAYALLTGGPLFEAQSVTEVLFKQVHLAVQPPSAKLGKPISAGLEALVMRCLSKNRDQRPASARAMIADLLRCVPTAAWTEQDAEAWWHARDQHLALVARTATTLDMARPTTPESAETIALVPKT
jgi:hypothetical protein